MHASSYGVVYANGSLRVDAAGTAEESGFFLSSFDATGADHAELGSTGTSFAVGTSIAVSAGGNVYVAGRFAGSSDFGGGDLQGKDTSAVLASYDAKLGHRVECHASQREKDFVYKDYKPQ